jgi:NADPH2:quinone reductase
MTNTKSYPETMKAVFLDGPGSRLVVREIKTPEPGPNEVLIRMIASPVNPSDLARIKDAPKEYGLATFIPGLEGSGIVVAAGKGILPHLWLGKRVACSAHYPASGTWAEYMVTKATGCFPLGKKISYEQGSMSLVNPLTAIAFFEIAKRITTRQ